MAGSDGQVPVDDGQGVVGRTSDSRRRVLAVGESCAVIAAVKCRHDFQNASHRTGEARRGESPERMGVEHLRLFLSHATNQMQYYAFSIS